MLADKVPESRQYFQRNDPHAVKREEIGCMIEPRVKGMICVRVVDEGQASYWNKWQLRGLHA